MKVPSWSLHCTNKHSLHTTTRASAEDKLFVTPCIFIIGTELPFELLVYSIFHFWLKKKKHTLFHLNLLPNWHRKLFLNSRCTSNLKLLEFINIIQQYYCYFLFFLGRCSDLSTTHRHRWRDQCIWVLVFVTVKFLNSVRKVISNTIMKISFLKQFLNTVF